jgi:hypothetical protein
MEITGMTDEQSAGGWEERMVYEEEYKQSRNPLYPLSVLRKCLESRQAIPEWVLAYLRTSLDALTSPLDPPKRNIAAFVANALGFGSGRGESSVFTRFSDFHKGVATWCHVREFCAKEAAAGRPAKLDAAIWQVAEQTHVSYTTVWNRHKKFQERVQTFVGPLGGASRLDS